MHEFQITRDDTALFALYDTQPADLRIVDGPENGWIYDGVFQEVDVETNELLFQWRASDHFKFNEAYRGPEDRGGSKDMPWDFFHINSIDKDSRGNFLVSSRYMSCLTYVDGRTGDVIWRLGGKHNSFKDLSDGTATNMKWQHHGRFQEEDLEVVSDSDSFSKRAITLFDNSSRGKGATERTSRGLFIDIDENSMTAQVRQEYWNPIPISSQSQGSVQVLDNGNVLVGYGYNAAWTEFSMDGEVLCQVHFGPAGGFGDGNIISYRAFKHHWVGRPTTSPDVAFAERHVAVSWNGATEVVNWGLEGSGHGSNGTSSGDTNLLSGLDEFVLVSAVPKSGFETDIPIPSDMPYKKVRVVALDREGVVIGSTNAVDWDPEQFRKEILVVSGEGELPTSESHLGDVWLFVLGVMSAALVAFALWMTRSHPPLCSVERMFKKRPGKEARHENWRQFSSSEELDELGEFSDLETGDQAELQLLRDEN
jgi:hypothetical protein